jgi:predicted TPR repeat methyltransferase
MIVPQAPDPANLTVPYSELVRSDVVSYLETTANRYDLIFAADLLIYFGDLGPLLRAAAGAMAQGGLLAVSIEVAEREGFTLLLSGRFAHSSDYLEATATDFVILEAFQSNIRLEAGRPVSGLYVIMERR